MKAWILSARIKPLILGLGPIIVGVSLAFSTTDQIPWFLNGVIIFCVLCIQMAVHFFNDALDFLKGVDGVLRQGPKRAIQRGWLTPKQLLRAGWVCLFLAGLAGLVLVFYGGVAIFIVGVISLLLAYFYTGGRWPLAYTGWADLFVLLFFGLIPVGFVFYLNTGAWDLGAFVAGFPCGLLALNFLTINNLRDVKQDQKAHKKTLVVRWGKAFGFWEWVVAHYLAYVIGGVYCYFSFSLFFWPVFLLPFSFVLHYLLWRSLKQAKTYGKLFYLLFFHYLLFVCLFSLSFSR